MRPSPSRLEHSPRGVVARDPADAAAAPRARAAQSTLACAVSTPHVPTSASVLGERPRQVAVEDVAAGQAELGLELDRRARLQARLAAGGDRQSSIGSASTLSSERSVASIACALAAACSRANSRAGMCSPKQRQRLRARRAQLGPEDASGR